MNYRETTSLQNDKVRAILAVDSPEGDTDSNIDNILKRLLKNLKRASIGSFAYNIDESLFRYTFDEVIKESNGKITQRLEHLFDILVLLSLNHHLAKFVKDFLLKIIDKVSSSDETDLQYFIDLLTKNLNSSQLAKLENAYLPKKEKNSKEEKIAFAKSLIDLYSLHQSIAPRGNEYDSTSFFALDRHLKEAICWKKLEFSKSEDEDLSRLAGAIASKIWLFKVPLLRKYCEAKNIDFLALTFSEKAAYTKEALGFFSESEVTEILDGAVERELENRKKRFVVDKRRKYVNKRTTMGVELEMGLIPYSAIATYAFYESLDRPPSEPDLNFDKESEEKNLLADKDVKDVVEKVFAYKDLESQAEICDRNFRTVTRLIKKLETKDDGLDKIKLTEEIKRLINQMIDHGKKDLFSKYIEQGSEINLEFLKIFQNYWKAESLKLKIRATQDKTELESSIEEDGDDKYSQMAKLFDYHIAKIRFLGNHKIGYDAHAEHQLDFVK